MSRTAKILIGICAVSALVVVGWIGYQRLLAPATFTPTPAARVVESEAVVSAQGSLVPRRRAELAYRAGGRVSEVLVSEGQTVRRGDALVQLQDDDLAAALQQAQAAADAARANLEQVETGTRPEQVAQARAAVRAADAQLEAAIADRDRLTGGANDAQVAAAQARLAAAQVEQKLAQDAYDQIERAGATGTLEEQARFRLHAANQSVAAAQKALDEALSGSTQSVRSAQAAVAAAQAQRDLAQAQLDQAINGPTPSQVHAAQAAVAQADAAVQAARIALQEAALRAPFDGTMAQVLIEAGQVVAPGQVVASIADVGAWQVHTDDLSEVDVVHIRIGQPARISLDALPGMTLQGHVSSIASRAAVLRGDVTYTVKIDVDEPDPRLLWGMTAQVDIDARP